jgi:hypothetical protein
MTSFQIEEKWVPSTVAGYKCYKLDDYLTCWNSDGSIWDMEYPIYRFMFQLGQKDIKRITRVLKNCVIASPFSISHLPKVDGFQSFDIPSEFTVVNRNACDPSRFLFWSKLDGLDVKKYKVYSFIVRAQLRFRRRRLNRLMILNTVMAKE